MKDLVGWAEDIVEDMFPQSIRLIIFSSIH